jgi:hypothetical protein
MIEGKHYHRSFNELDCSFDMDAIEAEMEAEDVVDFIERGEDKDLSALQEGEQPLEM